ILLARALLDADSADRSQFDLRVERKPEEIVQLGCQVGEAKLGRERSLLTFEHSGASIDCGDLQRVSIADIVFAFAQSCLGIRRLLIGGAFLKASEQNPVIKLVYTHRDFIFGLLQIVSRSDDFGGGDLICLVNANQLSERLRQSSSACRPVLTALSDRNIAI